jgi:outer membrane autotransporter protein
MRRGPSRRRLNRAAQTTAVLGGFFAAVTASPDGHAQPAEGGTTTTVICGVPITVSNGEGNGEGFVFESSTTVVSTECSPAAVLAFYNANFQALTNFYGNISNYMEMFRNNFGGPPPFSAYRPGAPTFQLASRGDLAGMGLGNNQPLFLAQAPSSVGGGTRFAVWAYGTGVFGHVAADGPSAGYRHRTGGILAGFDWQSTNWMIGAHAGYAGTHVRIRDDGSKVSINQAIVGVHGALRWDSGPFATFYVDGLFNVGFLDHDVTQSLTPLGFPGVLATGGPGGTSIGGKIELGSMFR